MERGRDVCLATASANVFEDASYPVPIVVFPIGGWDLTIHTIPPPRQTLYRAPSASYVVAPRRGDGIRFEHPNRVFRWGEVGEREVEWAEKMEEW
jgi:hypothetical protein